MDTVEGLTRDGCTIIVPRRIKHYELYQVMGQGSHSVVFEAVDVQSKLKYACKVMQRPGPNDKNIHFVERELRISETIHCPFLVSMIDVIYLDELIVVVMERCNGGDLCKLVESGIIAVRSVSRGIFRQLCLGVYYLHERRVAHRDVKLDNILLDKDFNVKLCDYGLACECKPGCLSDEICGSLPYIAPEVIIGEYDPRKADVWSVGIVLYMMIMEKSPYMNVDIDGIYNEIMTEGIDTSCLPEGPKQIVERCCEVDPEKRAGINEVLQMVYKVYNSHTKRAESLPMINTCGMKQGDVKRVQRGLMLPGNGGKNVSMGGESRRQQARSKVRGRTPCLYRPRAPLVR